MKINKNCVVALGLITLLHVSANAANNTIMVPILSYLLDSTNTKTVGFTPIKVDILPAGQTRTFQAQYFQPAIYSLENNPDFIEIDSLSGLITCNAPIDSREHYNFNIIATVGGVAHKSDAIQGGVKIINQEYLALKESVLKAQSDRDISYPNIQNAIDTGAGVKTVKTSTTVLVPNNLYPDDVSKNSWDVIKAYYKDYSEDIELVIVDGDSGVIKKIDVADGQWHVPVGLVTKEGKFYYFRGASGERPIINQYDPKTNVFTENIIPLPSDFGNSIFSPAQMGVDGTIVIASKDFNKHIRVISIRSSDNTILDDSGSIGEYTTGHIYKVAADNKYIYILSGKVPWRVTQYNRATHEWKKIAESYNNANILQTAFGVTMKVDDKHYFLYEGSAYLSDNSNDWRAGTKPWPFPEGYSQQDKWQTIVLPQNPIEKILPTKADVIIQNADVINDEAELWIKQPSQSEYTKYSYTLNTYPSTVSRILQLKNKTILAASAGYGPFFKYNPSTNTSEYMPGKLGVSIGTMIEYNNKVYISGYPSGVLFEYDPSKEWTQATHSWKPGDAEIDNKEQSLNPRWCGQLGLHGSGVHKITSSAIGADGLLYFGGFWIRDGYGGGLGWYDTQTGEMNGIWEDFSNLAIRNIVAVGKYIVITTIPVTDVQLHKPKPDSARLLFFNTETKKVESFVEPFIGNGIGAGQIVAVDYPYIVGMSYDAVEKNTNVYRLNILTHQFDYKLKIDEVMETSYSVGQLIVKTEDNKILMLLGNTNSYKLDPISGEIEFLTMNLDNSTFYGSVTQGDAIVVGEDVYTARKSTITKLLKVLSKMDGGALPLS